MTWCPEGMKTHAFKSSLSLTHPPIHILEHHLICTGTQGISTEWLQLFHSGSRYPAATIPAALTKGTTPLQANPRAHCPPAAPWPPAGTEPEADTLSKGPQGHPWLEEAQQLESVKVKPAYRKLRKWQPSVNTVNGVEYHCFCVVCFLQGITKISQKWPQSSFFCPGSLWPHVFGCSILKRAKPESKTGIAFLKLCWIKFHFESSGSSC